MRLVIEPPAGGHLPDLAACQQTFVGHELPNQLVALQGFARILGEDGLDVEDARSIARRLASLARRTDENARRLADIGRILREPAWGHPVSPAAIALEAAAEARAMLPNSGLVVVADDDGLRLHCSGRLLHRVLRELLVNAARAKIGAAVAVTACVAGAACRLAVADNGPGLDDPRMLAEPFAAGRRPDAVGPGLGFFLVRQAAALWGARLEASSEPCRGLRVELSIPLSAPERR